MREDPVIDTDEPIGLRTDGHNIVTMPNLTGGRLADLLAAASGPAQEHELRGELGEESGSGTQPGDCLASGAGQPSRRITVLRHVPGRLHSQQRVPRREPDDALTMRRRNLRGQPN